MSDNPELAALKFGQHVKRRAMAVFAVPTVTIALVCFVLLVPAGEIAAATVFSSLSGVVFAWLAFNVYQRMIVRFKCPVCNGDTHIKPDKGDSTLFSTCDRCGRTWSLGLAPEDDVP